MKLKYVTSQKKKQYVQLCLEVLCEKGQSIQYAGLSWSSTQSSQNRTKNCYFPKLNSKSGRKKVSGRFPASCRRRASLGLRFISFLSGLTRDPPRSRIFVFLVKYFIWFYYPGLASCPPHYAVTSEKNENDDYSRKGAYHINHRHRLGNTPATE